MYIIEISKLHERKKKWKKPNCIKKQNMLKLSDQNVATNPQCYKDREDCSSRSSSVLCDCTLPFKRGVLLPLSFV